MNDPSTTSSAPVGAGRWYVVRTNPHGERVAKAQLEAKGFEVYLPMMLDGTRFRPLFPRYEFVRFDPSTSSWRAIFSTIGVSDLMMSSRQVPLAVPEIEIQKIKDADDAGLLRLIPEEELPCNWKRGDRVRLLDLPIEATFQERVDTKRVAVLWEVLGRETRQVVHLARVA